MADAAAPASAGSSPQPASSGTAVQDLAQTIVATASSTTPPTGTPSFLKGKVMASNYTGNPPTIDVQLSGDTSSTVQGVVYVDSYSPVVGDTVLIVKQGTDIFAIGQLNDSASGVSNGWTAPAWAPGVSGSAQCRLVVDNGDNKIQLKGSVNLSGSPTVLGHLPVGMRPSTYRQVAAARDGQFALCIGFDVDGSISISNVTPMDMDSGVTDRYTHTHTTDRYTHSHGFSWGNPTTGTSNNHTHTTNGVVSTGQNLDHSHSVSGSGSTGDDGSGHAHATGTDGSGHAHAVSGTPNVYSPSVVYFDNVSFFM